MGTPESHKPAFYGTATIGTKGQLVIPVEAREDLGIHPGTKVVVLGIRDHSMIGLCPIDSVEKMLAQLTEQLEHMRQLVETNKEGSSQDVTSS